MEERLTERYKDFRCPKCGEVISSASDVEFYQSRLQAQPEIAKALAKLAHYEDLEEQGRLIELPCAVGDTIYYLLGIPNKTPCEIEETKFYLSDLNRIGKDLFLTKAEAEAALKGAEHETR